MIYMIYKKKDVFDINSDNDRISYYKVVLHHINLLIHQYL